ncbi:hypothetical protein AKJ57_03305 [candidate division MSBL1 archaeon SCGC-AAA259A05]|uniref:Uncharacterized protein n=1 Tax=candidate division MSBL1 archaeon SCGC-AAA259A05 TaxID=1698259 RepID=A0A133U9S6_9EURY|nr:hypothetical protein AKJ57_03305 [candidate division MSBL1 archaeon SCGC-AAA259A05]
MRPSPVGIDKKRKKQIIVIGIAIVAAVICLMLILNFFSSEERQTPYFSEVELKDEKIKPGETTLLKTRILNPGSNVYENAKIRIISGSPKIKMSLTSPGAETQHENRTTPKGKFEQSLTVNIPYGLGKEFETGLYTFDMSGDIYSGISLMKAEIEAHLIVDGEPTDNKVLELTISSED